MRNMSMCPFDTTQLERPLSNFFQTNTTLDGNKMSDVTTTLLNSTFEKPRKSKSYEPYSTIFCGEEEEDYADYYIHVDNSIGKVACSKSESLRDIRSVDDDEASTLLCGLKIDTTLYGNVQKFLVRKHQTSVKSKRKRNVTTRKSTAQQRATLSTPSSTNRPTSSGTVESSTSLQSPEQKRQRNDADVANVGLSSAVSNDEDETSSTPKSINDLLYGEDGKLRAEVIDALRHDKEYMLVKREDGRDAYQAAYSVLTTSSFRSTTKMFIG